jgi:AcrR family transcriptional regulator
VPARETRAGPGRELPVIGQPAAERADAARNRRKIMATAERLLDTRGVNCLTMNEVAAAAGVGVGTIYRRFGDRAGLVRAMMDHRERRLQREFISGPPPLGPGAPPITRIRAFLHAYVDLLDAYAPLLAMAETSSPTSRYNSPVYAVHHVHLTTLIAQARPQANARFLADALLATLGAGQFIHQRHRLGLDTDQIKTGLDELLDGLWR